MRSVADDFRGVDCCSMIRFIIMLAINSLQLLEFSTFCVIDLLECFASIVLLLVVNNKAAFLSLFFYLFKENFLSVCDAFGCFVTFFSVLISFFFSFESMVF